MRLSCDSERPYLDLHLHKMYYILHFCTHSSSTRSLLSLSHSKRRLNMPFILRSTAHRDPRQDHVFACNASHAARWLLIECPVWLSIYLFLTGRGTSNGWSSLWYHRGQLSAGCLHALNSFGVMGVECNPRGMITSLQCPFLGQFLLFRCTKWPWCFERLPGERSSADVAPGPCG